MIFTVGTKDASKTLLAFLRGHLFSYPSIKAIKRAIEAGHCRVNGKIETFSTHKVKEKDQIEMMNAHISLPKENSCEKMILFEDEDLILLNKPAGIVSEEFSSFLLVHRLDKHTSGVILFAKTLAMQKKLIVLFRERKIKKTYLAICDGQILKRNWVVDNFLEKKASYDGGSIYGKARKRKGKRAITHFQLLQSQPSASLVKAFPITGRTHQIRVHLEGNPILGDLQYGRRFQCLLQPPRLMLHSSEISFSHPILGNIVHCIAPPLEDFLYVKRALFEATACR